MGDGNHEMKTEDEFFSFLVRRILCLRLRSADWRTGFAFISIRFILGGQFLLRFFR